MDIGFLFKIALIYSVENSGLTLRRKPNTYACACVLGLFLIIHPRVLLANDYWSDHVKYGEGTLRWQLDWCCSSLISRDERWGDERRERLRCGCRGRWLEVRGGMKCVFEWRLGWESLNHLALQLFGPLFSQNKKGTTCTLQGSNFPAI